VGGYDMMSFNVADHSAYSKYALGWITPQVVEGLAAGESIELTLENFAKTGDAIVIPAAGEAHDGPFGEYILLELLTADGVFAPNAAAYGLQDTAGVRISHINSLLEQRTLQRTDGSDFRLGTYHTANAFSQKGRYLIETIQRGGVNTFTDRDNLNPILQPADLFTAGDTFTAEAYSAFLEGGRMDSGAAFGYTVEILSLTADSATIRITAD